MMFNTVTDCLIMLEVLLSTHLRWKKMSVYTVPWDKEDDRGLVWTWMLAPGSWLRLRLWLWLWLSHLRLKTNTAIGNIRIMAHMGQQSICYLLLVVVEHVFHFYSTFHQKQNRFEYFIIKMIDLKSCLNLTDFKYFHKVYTLKALVIPCFAMPIK